MGSMWDQCEINMGSGNLKQNFPVIGRILQYQSLAPNLKQFLKGLKQDQYGINIGSMWDQCEINMGPGILKQNFPVEGSI